MAREEGHLMRRGRKMGNKKVKKMGNKKVK